MTSPVSYANVAAIGTSPSPSVPAASSESKPTSKSTSVSSEPVEKKLLRNPQMKKIQLKNQTKFLQQQNLHLHLPNLQRKL